MSRLIFPLSFFVLFLSACAPPLGGPVKKEKPSNEKIVYTTAKAIARDVQVSFQATGSFIAEESSDVAPAIGGRVAATPVDVGDYVRKGQAICVLEQREAQLRVDQARAGREQAKFMFNQAQSRVGWSGDGNFDPDLVPEVASAQASYESALASARLAAADAKRYENLVNSGDVSQSSYEKAKTQQQTAEAAANSARKQYEAQVNNARQNYRAIEAAQASMAAAESQLAQAEKNLADTTIRAPFDGHITDRPVSVGQWVGTNNKVATLVRISTVRLQLQVPEQRAAEVITGMTVTARVAAYPNRDFTGKVHAVVPSVDQNSRAFIVEARFDNPKVELRPGMFANAKLMLPGTERGVFVPAKAVFYDNTTDANHVYSVGNGIAHLNVVLKGDTDGDQVRILSGLTGNETVVIDNQAGLYDGASVQTQ
ncbi:MAG: efflux transporter, family, subunit [Acidobacteria bacterium]|jgi:RND family efflux transporter MFP subunit|nr:efflux transporter, family, subunit [Acidobacteriota bacterium]